jgi:hypothetical protein
MTVLLDGEGLSCFFVATAVEDVGSLVGISDFWMLDTAGFVSFVEDGDASQLYLAGSLGGSLCASACRGVSLLIVANDGKTGCCWDPSAVGADNVSIGCCEGDRGIFTVCAAPFPVLGKKIDDG